MSYSDSIGVEGEDFIVDLCTGGYLHILDKIVLGLKLENLHACGRVNRQWFKIMEYYRKSDIPRIKKIILKIVMDANVVSKLDVFELPQI